MPGGRGERPNGGGLYLQARAGTSPHRERSTVRQSAWGSRVLRGSAKHRQSRHRVSPTYSEARDTREAGADPPRLIAGTDRGPSREMSVAGRRRLVWKRRSLGRRLVGDRRVASCRWASSSAKSTRWRSRHVKVPGDHARPRLDRAFQMGERYQRRPRKKAPQSRAPSPTSGRRIDEYRAALV